MTRWSSCPGQYAFDGRMMFIGNLLMRVDRDEIHVERRLGGCVRAGRLDRRVLLRREVNRAVELGSPDLDEALEIIALHQLLGEPGERHRVGLEEAPRFLPRHRALALRSVIDDDLRLLPVQQLEHRIQLVGDVVGVVLEVLALFDVERERLGPQRVAADADHLLRRGVVEQIKRGVDSERAARSQNGIRFHSVLPSSPRVAGIVGSHSSIVQ